MNSSRPILAAAASGAATYNALRNPQIALPLRAVDRGPGQHSLRQLLGVGALFCHPGAAAAVQRRGGTVHRPLRYGLRQQVRLLPDKLRAKLVTECGKLRQPFRSAETQVLRQAALPHPVQGLHRCVSLNAAESEHQIFIVR